MSDVKSEAHTDWKSSACILCECNCGIEVQLGGEDDAHIVRIRGDKAHPDGIVEQTQRKLLLRLVHEYFKVQKIFRVLQDTRLIDSA